MNFDGSEASLFEPHELEEQSIRIDFPGYKTKDKLLVRDDSNFNSKIRTRPQSFEEYLLSFRKVQDHLMYGNTFLTNLTASTTMDIDLSMDAIYEKAKAKYKIKFASHWVCFSPESFVQIQQGTIASYPMKGTIDAAIPHAKEIILNDPKETAEHYTIVDLIRNDLAMVSEEVHVRRFRYIDLIETNTKSLYQVSSEITGRLAENYLSQLGNILFALLPAGSISGAPKKKTVEIIHEAEYHQRGFYTGVAFYFDGENLDSCVLIRFIENTPDGLVYKSGGGITINSKAEDEYQELLDKIYVPGI